MGYSTTSSNGTTITIATCVLCDHDFNMHVPPCPPSAPCGGDDFVYCVQCWDEGKDAGAEHPFMYSAMGVS